MNIKLYTGQYEIVGSSTVMLFDKKSNLIINIDADGFKFSIELIFVDGAKENQIIDRTIDPVDNKITLVCNNFNNIFGTNTSVPVSIATVNKKQMYLHLYVSLLEDGIRRVNYTILIERQAKYE